MSEESVQVEAARIPDRDRLLEDLKAHGLDARPDGEMGIEIRCDTDDADAANDVYHEVEKFVMALGAPFVPIKHEGVVYVRPPIS
jgi:hypothetical protein